MSGFGFTPILEPIVTRLLGYPPTPAYHEAYSPRSQPWRPSSKSCHLGLLIPFSPGANAFSIEIPTPYLPHFFPSMLTSNEVFPVGIKLLDTFTRPLNRFHLHTFLLSSSSSPLDIPHAGKCMVKRSHLNSALVLDGR